MNTEMCYFVNNFSHPHLTRIETGVASLREIMEASPSTTIRSLLIQEGLEKAIENEGFRKIAQRQGTEILTVSEAVMRKVCALHSVYADDFLLSYPSFMKCIL